MTDRPPDTLNWCSRDTNVSYGVPGITYRIQDTLGWHYAAVALPMALLVTVTVFLMEWFINWEDDLPYYVSQLIRVFYHAPLMITDVKQRFAKLHKDDVGYHPLTAESFQKS